MRIAFTNALFGGALLATAVTAVVVIGHRLRSEPARCPDGTVALDARCCPEGQTLQGTRCWGTVRRCPSATELVTAGCVARVHVVRFAGGALDLVPNDWEAPALLPAVRAHVAGFGLDSDEVTIEAWQKCVEAGACRPLAVEEPGLPVRGVSPVEAERYCRLVGGRLPRGEEWLWAAAGAEGRRYPWGPTGLVCRRAAYGLVDGPCGRGGVGPDLAGLRPDGASPEGVLDLAGNVAEWTVEPGGRHAARGGSFRSELAADLMTWAALITEAASESIGFRCAYDPGGPG